MKKIFVAVCFICLSLFGFSQNNIEVQHNSKGMYVVHTVHPKDNFYSVGRLYHVSPKEIAAFNALDMNGGLSVGQSLLIPLNASNFSQTKATGTPVYYVVGEKEGLYRVSLKNNKVLMANLRKWNHLTSDNISTGQKLIVGYLQATDLGNVTTAAPVAKTETASPAAKEPEHNEDTQPAAQPKETTKTEAKPVETKAADAKPTTTTSKTAPVAGGGSGYFKGQYEQQTKAHKAGLDETVTSGIFKTTSGFQDAKYYALMDKVEPGTIVQVVNPANNKSIYAKVLGEMSGIRQNQGLDLRISNAAATALEISDPDKFIVRVLY